MTKLTTLRAAVIGGTIAFASVAAAQDDKTSISRPQAQESAREITIWRDPGCGCCDSYADYLETHGYDVTRVDDVDFDKRSVTAGVPAQGIGCHLAEIGGYYVSGLVPADIIERLLAEGPDITGITLPGMPANAPGMAQEKHGRLTTYAFGKDGVSVYSDE